MRGLSFFYAAAVLLPATLVGALRYDPAHFGYNLNENETATRPMDYWGEWKDHTFTPSPKNWRFPFYTLFLDRFVNGDPANDDANGTVFESDPMTNQLRYGGDLAGLVDSLDYLQGMGIKVRFTPFFLLGERGEARRTRPHGTKQRVFLAKPSFFGFFSPPILFGQLLIRRATQALYIAGTPFINVPWKADSYSVSRASRVQK